MVDHLAVVWIGPQEYAAEAQLLTRIAHFLDRQVDRLHRQHGDTEQPVRIGLAVIRKPAVVRPCHRGGHARILYCSGEQPDAWIQEGGVDAVHVHVRNARMRIEAALAALFVFHRVVHNGAVACSDSTQCAHALFAAQQLLADLQSLLAVGVADDLRGLVAEGWVHVVVPQCERFEDVAVGVDHVIGAGHGLSPVGLLGRQLPCWQS